MRTTSIQWRLRAALAFAVMFSPGMLWAQTVTPIHDIQGSAASSPILGSVVTIRGIVTGVKSNGFFVQGLTAGPAHRRIRFG